MQFKSILMSMLVDIVLHTQIVRSSLHSVLKVLFNRHSNLNRNVLEDKKEHIILKRKLLSRTLRTVHAHTLILYPWRHSWKKNNKKKNMEEEEGVSVGVWV